MGEKKPMVIRANNDGFLPCPQKFNEIDITTCVACFYRWAFGSENGDPTTDCAYTMTMTPERLAKYEDFRDFCYNKEPPYQRPEEDIEADAIIDERFSHMHPHQRSEID